MRIAWKRFTLLILLFILCLSAVSVVSAMETKPGIADAIVSLSETTFTYNGTEQKPDIVSVKLGDTTLTEGSDYSVGWPADMTNAGSKSIAISGLGEYAGTGKTVAYTVNKCSTEGCSVYLEPGSAPYTGSEIQLKTILITGISYPNGLYNEFDVEYIGDRVNAGTFTVKATAKDSGNFTGSLSGVVTIAPVSLEGKTVTPDPASCFYTGSECRPAVSIDGIDVSKCTVTYENNIKVGTATVIVTGDGTNYTGSTSADFRIEANALTENMVSLSANTFEYDQKEQRPVVAVTCGSALKEGTDYTVAFDSDVTDAGEKTVTITGIGNYTGTVAINYAIVPCDITKADIDPGVPEIIPYDGEEHVPAPTVTYGTNALKEDTDYTVTLPEDMTNVGAKTVTLTGIGNYGGTCSYMYIIEEHKRPRGTSLVISRESYVQYSRERVYDTDGDGLNDTFEKQVADSDPNKVDTDGDGIDDLRSYLLRSFLGENTAAAALKLRLGQKTSFADAFLNGAETLNALNILAERGYLTAVDPVDTILADGGTVVRGDESADLLEIGNVCYIKSDPEKTMLFGVNTESDLFVTFDVNDGAMAPDTAFDLTGIFGGSYDHYAIAFDDQAKLFAIAPWDMEKECALADVAVLIPENGNVWTVNNSEGADRFDIAPDGSKIAWLKDGAADLLDLISCNPSGIYTANASVLSFSADGGMITDIDGTVAAVWTVRNDKPVSERCTFSGMIAIKQPTTNRMAYRVILGSLDNISLDVSSTFDLDVNGTAGSPSDLSSLTYVNAQDREAVAYPDFFAE